ncbi:MATE family efflux transporter [Bradyrhizobium sp. CB1015]|uniref:MATE family efflux transporter n=1 Tax=Bradyrhizobium sp. CB1015 TaxID=2976822 RepID=UPI0021AA9B1B|nr:MATE family efflux transporter [Bradyrhizobium sp. CB1015]UWU95735.1 MATE family efflux transporter [Bradyrhizobium sp. CB1015]
MLTPQNLVAPQSKANALSVYRELLRNTLPVLSTNMIGLVVGLLELKIAGTLGSNTLAAIATAFVWVSMVQSFSLAAYCIGSTRATAIRKGTAALSSVLLSALVGGVAIGMSFSVLIVILCRPLLLTAGLQGSTLEEGVQFLILTAASFPPLFVLGGVQGFLRGVGLPNPASFIVNGSLVLGLALAVIFAHPALLGLGYQGLAAATVVSCWIGALVALIYLRWDRAVALHLSWNIWNRFDRSIFADILRISYPAALVWIIVAVTALCSQHLLAAFGLSYLGGFGLVMRLETVVGVVASAFSAGLIYAATELVRANRTAEIVSIKRSQQQLLSMIIMPFVIVCLAFPTWWPRLFTDDLDLVQAAARNGQYFVGGLLFMGLTQVASSGLIALGYPLRMVGVIVTKNLVLTLPLMYGVEYLRLQPLPDALFVAQVLGAPLAWLLAEYLLRTTIALYQESTGRKD